MTHSWKLLLDGVTTETPEQTESYGADLACGLPPDSVLALQGDLGSGKTTFVRGMARGLHIDHPITSPTFNIHSLYHGDRCLIHCDAYRLTEKDSFDSLHLEEFMVSPWILAIEWPENIRSEWLAAPWTLHLSIDSKSTKHFLKLVPPG